MCRSILLNQDIKDIDFFFVGLSEDEIRVKLYKLVNTTMESLKSENPDCGFVLMYKPAFKVVEIVCTKPVEKKESLDVELSDNQVSEEEYTVSQSKELSKEEKLFMENRMLYKIQIIMKAHKSLDEIFENFDLYPCCVAFDGKTTYLNQAGSVPLLQIYDKFCRSD